MSFEILVV